MASLFAHALFVVGESTDPYMQDISIERTSDPEPTVTRGSADYTDQIGPKPFAATVDVQYPRVGRVIDWVDLWENDKSFRCAWVDGDGKRGSAENCRVTSCPLNDVMKGERKQQVKIIGFMTKRPAE